jgi:hypothetical protein
MTWWLSFWDPEARRLLGVVLVEAPTFLAAVDATWDAGCNPGGEVQGLPVRAFTSGWTADQITRVLQLPRLTVLSRADIEAGGTRCTTPDERRPPILH